MSNILMCYSLLSVLTGVHGGIVLNQKLSVMIVNPGKEVSIDSNIDRYDEASISWYELDTDGVLCLSTSQL